MKINGSTNISGIFGFPVKHTLSPSMHNAAYEKLGINFAYIPFEVDPKDLKEAVNSLRLLKISGINVTVPHKESVMKYLDKIDPLALKIGSVNTVVNKNGKLHGFNTDGTGFITDLRNCGFNPKDKTAFVMGTGGGGKAVATSLVFFGAKKVLISDKDEAKAKKLSKTLKNCVFIPFNQTHKYIENCALIVNTTPLGMHNQDPVSIDIKNASKKSLVYDIVYNRKTELLKTAEKLGLKSCSGLGMLLSQGAIAFELITGKKAPVSIMKNALIKSFKHS